MLPTISATTAANESPRRNLGLVAEATPADVGCGSSSVKRARSYQPARPNAKFGVGTGSAHFEQRQIVAVVDLEAQHAHRGRVALVRAAVARIARVGVDRLPRTVAR